jgi:RNA polymerase sigma-70 factor (ECF subfamily)
MMTWTDAELVNRLQSGDGAALETAYRRHVAAVWRYAWFRTRDRDAAAEIVQDTFLRATRYAKSFAGRSSLRTWLFALGRSATVDWIRRQRRQQETAMDPATLRLIAATGDPVDGEEIQQRVRDALAALPAAQRDALVLFELEGLSIREVADVLNWSESRVKTTLCRGRKRLRILLDDLVQVDVETTRQAE